MEFTSGGVGDPLVSRVSAVSPCLGERGGVGVGKWVGGGGGGK